MFGFVGETTQAAADDFFPGYRTMMSVVGKERGWPPITRAQYDATRGPKGAFLIGEPEAVVDKVLEVNEDLGGVARLDFQMTSAHLEHGKMLKAIELLGEKVAPAVKKALG
jgi:alkanesulfonate monooxygenase SsuD/methylene tetrahydromethanopterin reductase-like flavin-dependent oxidoreductase (luciferase family)